MTIPPLYRPGFAVVGPNGDRDNVQRLMAVLAATLPPTRRPLAVIQHHPSCPRAPNGPADDACTCDTVDVTVHAVQVGAS